jgi:hypothetical protein
LDFLIFFNLRPKAKNGNMIIFSMMQHCGVKIQLYEQRFIGVFGSKS